MKESSRRIVAVGVAASVIAIAAWAALGSVTGAARAQSVSVLSEADVELRDIGRLQGTSIVYVEFADGGRCIVSDNGAGDVDCDW